MNERIQFDDVVSLTDIYINIIEAYVIINFSYNSLKLSVEVDIHRLNQGSSSLWYFYSLTIF